MNESTFMDAEKEIEREEIVLVFVSLLFLFIHWLKWICLFVFFFSFVKNIMIIYLSVKEIQ